MLIESPYHTPTIIRLIEYNRQALKAYCPFILKLWASTALTGVGAMALNSAHLIVVLFKKMRIIRFQPCPMTAQNGLNACVDLVSSR